MAVIDLAASRIQLALQALAKAPTLVATLPVEPTPAMVAAIALMADIDIPRSREVYAVLLAAAEKEGY